MQFFQKDRIKIKLILHLKSQVLCEFEALQTDFLQKIKLFKFNQASDVSHITFTFICFQLKFQARNISQSLYSEQRLWKIIWKSRHGAIRWRHHVLEKLTYLRRSKSKQIYRIRILAQTASSHLGDETVLKMINIAYKPLKETFLCLRVCFSSNGLW